MSLPSKPQLISSPKSDGHHVQINQILWIGWSCLSCSLLLPFVQPPNTFEVFGQLNKSKLSCLAWTSVVDDVSARVSQACQPWTNTVKWAGMDNKLMNLFDEMIPKSQSGQMKWWIFWLYQVQVSAWSNQMEKSILFRCGYESSGCAKSNCQPLRVMKLMATSSPSRVRAPANWSSIR